MNLDKDSEIDREERRGRERALSEDEEKLLVGFAIATRTSHRPLSLADLSNFCTSYLSTSPSYSTLSRIMNGYGFTSQKAMDRNSRMVSEGGVEDALSFILEIRSYNFPPNRLIFMDETGLWSNVAAPRTYHYKNWSANLLSLKIDPFGTLSY